MPDDPTGPMAKLERMFRPDATKAGKAKERLGKAAPGDTTQAKRRMENDTQSLREENERSLKYDPLDLGRAPSAVYQRRHTLSDRIDANADTLWRARRGQIPAHSGDDRRDPDEHTAALIHALVNLKKQ